MSTQLFAAIRRGKVRPGVADEFAKRVKAGALPAMQKMDGFKGYYLIAGADDTIIAVSLFTNKTVAETSGGDEHPEKMRQRRETVEHPFGTIKARMGATSFLMKTLPRVCLRDGTTRSGLQLHPRNEHMGLGCVKNALGRAQI